LPNPDLILLHAPSIYDFRKMTILYGPVSDLVPPSPAFELYPIGITSIAAYLEKAGYNVRIINLAVRMARSPTFNAEALIKQVNAPLFGIDLHWMVHCHGSIEVAKLVKKHHPQAKVLFGGLSSSYFFRELMEYPEIDYVLRGDSTEEPLRQLMDCLKKQQDPENVPNLVWRDSTGTVRENPLSHVPTDLGNVLFDYYPHMIKSVIKYRDLAGHIPFADWLRYPITGVLTCRGCTENCVICGGSAYAFRRSFNRPHLGSRPPERVAKDVAQIAAFTRGPIFILGDLLQQGENYAYDVLRRLQQLKVKNQLIFELFNPAPKELFLEMQKASPGFCLEISPESHDPGVRMPAGRRYASDTFEQTLRDALAAGCGRVDIYYMIGIPKQTPQSVMDTVDYCDHLLQEFNHDKRLALFISPLSPFLDPGSLGYEQPQRYGYRIKFHTLAQHRQGLISPSWKYSLNYETDWMDRHQIANTSYEAILRLNRVKAKHGVIPADIALLSERRIAAAAEMMHRLDTVLAQGDYREELGHLQPQIRNINALPVSEKIQLELPMGLTKLRLLRTAWSWATGRW
jgi:B12-binding domain/radical SAM domain protein